MGIERSKINAKKRYQIMSQYMPKVGNKGLDMMMRTTTIKQTLILCLNPT